MSGAAGNSSTFVVLCKFDRSALSVLLGQGADQNALFSQTDSKTLMQALSEGSKGEVIGLWFTTGEYDLAAVVQAPSNQDALGFLLAFSELGNVTTLTLAAAEAAAVIKAARDAHTKMHTKMTEGKG